MRPFQIIFNPTSAAELAQMPKELQLQILGEFRVLPQQVMQATKFTEDLQLQFLWHLRQLSGTGGIEDDLERPHELEFRGLPQQVMQTELDEFGKLERAGRI